MTDWDSCDHEWRETDEAVAVGHTGVICKKCACPGERYDKTGDIFWPAT